MSFLGPGLHCSGLSSRYLKDLVDKGFDDVRSLAIGEEKLIEYGDTLPGHAIKVPQAAIVREGR